MKIKFVNHSSFIIEHNGVSIIADPWLEGKVFNNGWSLISETKLPYEGFADIQYIWFSHEHPDHFYPPNLKKITPEIKKDITVLFQHTIDGRVSNYCRKAGFKEVWEMERGKFYSLADDFKVMCEHFSEGDSWICYKVGDLTILNTNDCGIRNQSQADYIKNKVGKVDILLTQFSYAYWVGNPDEVAYRKQKADEKLKWMKFQCDVFEPKVTIPIASYIYFCHEENFYLNDAVNTAEKTYNYLKQNTTTEPVVLYNGDEYTFPEAWDSLSAIQKYKNDFAKIELNKKEMLEKNVPVASSDLVNQANIFVENLNTKNNFLVKSVLKPTHIFLWDLNKAYTLSLANGFTENNLSKENCDVLLSSESLLFCLKFPYGLDTTQINGRMQKAATWQLCKILQFF